MLKLKINTTRQINSNDLRIACDPPLYFDVRTFIPPDLVDKIADWERAGSKDFGTGAALLAQVFVSITQDDQTYSLSSPVEVNDLRETIEAANPGQGDGFICAMLEGFTANHYRFFRIGLTGSPALPPVSANGSAQPA